MSYVFDRNGNPKKVAAGYILQDGERSMGTSQMIHDGAVRIALTDSAPKIAIGDAVMTDTVNGLERVTFADGSSALKLRDGWSYFWSNGQQARSLTRDQQAHQARAGGATLRQWADAYVEGEGNRLAARASYVDRLANAWRG